MRYRNYALATFLLLAITGIALLSIYLLQPPEAKPANAPETEFSAGRAMAHVQKIAQEPHAMGTEAHAEVRAYLLDTMRRLNLNPQVQEATVGRTIGDAAYAGYVYNLLGRLPGKGSGKAILLMAHYDSQPNTLGAGDDGAGVAALLETARALQSGSKLEHDVIFLLTDGEEYGLYGARAFMEHPWAKDVAFVLNVEARGNEGPSLTFEMNPENGWVIKEFLKAAPYPYVSSLAYEIYSRMPNNTDFTIFKDAGYTGVNSAFMDGWVHYHKATDSPENLDQSSLQHHGSNLLALTRHFGTISLENTKAPNSVFFNFINGWVINYPQELNWLWFALTAIVLVVTLVIGKQRGALTIGQTLLGFVAFTVLLAVVAGLFIPINSLVTGMLPFWHSHNGVYSSDGFLVAYLLLAAGMFLLLSWVLLRWVPLISFLMGVYLVHFVLTVALLLLMPAAAYLLLFPLLFCLIGILIVLLLRLYQNEKAQITYSIVMVLSVLPALFIITPIVQVVFVAFALQLPIGSVVLFLLLLGLLLPLLAIIEESFSWKTLPLFPIVLLLAGTIQVLLAVNNESPSAEKPLHSQVSYHYNADSGRAVWATAYTTTDDWNSQFFTNPETGALQQFYPHARREYLLNQAEALDLKAPVAEVLQDSAAEDTRFLRLRLHSPRSAAHMEIILQPQDTAALQGISLNGVKLEPKPIPVTNGAAIYYIRYHGLPVSKEGILDVQLAPDASLRLMLYDHSLALPQQLVKLAMPAHVVPEQGDNSNVTVVKKSFQF